MSETTQTTQAQFPTCMESVNRIAKLPVVESSIQAATNVYEKVKDFNSVTQWTCSTAENVVQKAIDVSKPIANPIVQGLDGPIKKVDGVLCSGLDYVEEKVPAVKMPAGEIYTNTKDYVNNTVTPKVAGAYAYVEPAMKSAYEKIEPAVETAKHVVEPAVEKAKPYVEPVLEKARSMVEHLGHRVEEQRQCSRGHPEGNYNNITQDEVECEECQAVARNMEEN